MFIALTPLQVFAYPGGLLDGRSGSYNGSPETKVTDGNLSTYVHLNNNLSSESARFRISPLSVSTVSSYKLYSEMDGSAIEIFFYNSSLQQIGYVYPAVSNGTRVDLSTPITGVYSIIVKNGSSGTAPKINEFDVFSSVPDITPPDIPTNLNAIANDGSVDLTWNAVTAVDLAGYNLYLNGTKVNMSLITALNYTAVASNNVNNIWTLTAVDTNANESLFSNAVTTHYDTISPLSPVGLVANPNGTGVITLDWTDNTEPDLAGYSVYQDNSKITTSLLTESEYTISSLANDVLYNFAITATDLSNNESLKSSSITYYKDSNAPDSPTTLEVTDFDHDSIELYWDSNSEIDLLGYNVYVNGIKHNTSLLGSNVYVLTNMTPETNYTIHVTALDDAMNESPNSNTVVVTTSAEPDTIPPSVVISVYATGGNGWANVSWQPNTETDISGYNVYVDSVKHNTTLISGTNYLISGLENGETYSVHVVAVDTSGNESSPSVPVNVMPDGSGLPHIDMGFSLLDVADGVASWFSSIWGILAFSIAIPLSFVVARRVKDTILP